MEPPPAGRRGAQQQQRSPAPPPSNTSPTRSSSVASTRPDSSGSDASSTHSNLSVVKRSPYIRQLPTFQSTTSPSLPYTRPSAQYMPQDGRKPTLAPPPENLQRHRPRQHSQGYFEPSLPSASLASQSNLHDNANMPGHLTASQIAAQAAFQHLQVSGPASQHNRRRSQTVPVPDDKNEERRNSRGSATSSQDENHSDRPQYKNGLIGNNAATTAASAAFPRLTSAASSQSSLILEEKEPKKGGLKRFRPKNMTLSRDKDKEAKDKPLPSPNKTMPSGLSKVMNVSTASLADSLSSTNSSLYQLNSNPSQTTIIPVPDGKDKKHTGLRQKLKLKDKDDHHLQLSSAHSNSRPTDINNPQSLYSFAPSSPGPTQSTFSKTVSGLDLRHAGRALREKKKEEKAQAHAQAEAAALHTTLTHTSEEWPLLTTTTTSTSGGHTPYSTDLTHTLSSFGINNMTADDAWDFLKAKLLNVFSNEVDSVRIAVEDLNKLVSIHVSQCVKKRDPSIIIGDLEDLLRTGFLSLNHTLRDVREDLLVPHLVSMWLLVFSTILPFMQAVFLPLDQEFKGRGKVLTSPRMANEFWGATFSAQHNTSTSDSLSGSAPGSETYLSTSPEQTTAQPINDSSLISASEELETRRILLIAYRDIVILPKYNLLHATFSRLSLDSISATLAHLESEGSLRGRGDSQGSDIRPGTSASQHSGAHEFPSSYNSQASTLLNHGLSSSSSASVSGARSRAMSNLSQTSGGTQADMPGSFPSSFGSPSAYNSLGGAPAVPSAAIGMASGAAVTETVGRMLQCLSVLCSMQTGDEAQSKMEELNKQLKLNWLGRGRTGRNRKGFVGTRVRGATTAGISEADKASLKSVGGGSLRTIRREREGSPTPTPTRQGTVNIRPESRTEVFAGA